MELLTLILFIVIIVLILNLRSSFVQQTQVLQKELRELREKLSKTNIAEPPATFAEPKKEEQAAAHSSVIQPYEKQIAETLFVIPEKPVPVIDKADKVIEPPQLQVQEMIAAAAVANSKPPHPEKPGFFERHPDLEKFIGENLISKIGVAIVVLAIGYFVKFAIDNNWIGTAGRVAIGILCGGILVGLAHVLRKNYHAFSSVLAGGGLAVFYFTIALAYHEYHLFNQLTTFIILIIITAFAVLLSALYNRQELAVISLIGGFATPFMASNGTGNYTSLFTYLLILNTGLLFIAYRKSWRLLNLLAFLFTIILFASWLVLLPADSGIAVYKNGFIYATLFYLLFIGINLAYNIREHKKFIASDFGIILANTAVYFSAGLYLITQMEATQLRGLFSAALGVFNLGLSYTFFRNKKADSNIIYLLIGVTLTFISLTAPIQLSGNHITLFWASETVLLFWLFQKSRIPLIRLSSAIVWIAMLLSLLMDWIDIYSNSSIIQPILANKGFITTLYAALSCIALLLLKRKEEETKRTGMLSISPGKTVLLIAGIVLLYASGAFEINLQFVSRYPLIRLNTLYLLSYTFLFVLVLTMLSNKLQLFKNYLPVAILYAASVLIYLFATAEVFHIQYGLLSDSSNHVHFMAHWVSAVIVFILLFRLIDMFYTTKIVSKNNAAISWLISVAAVAVISIEGSLLSNTIFYTDSVSLRDISRVYIKVGLPIIWGICSLVLMWLGMRHKYRPLRIASLLLFAITLLKLFLFDIRNIPIAGKIAAFFCLGILLLIVSFMYQRLKIIIIENEQNPQS